MVSSAGPLHERHSVGAWRSLVARSVRDAEVGGSNPLAPTTYGYSEPLRQYSPKAVGDCLVRQMQGEFAEPPDLDALEHRLRQHPSPGSAVCGLPGATEFTQVSDSNGGRDPLRHALLSRIELPGVEPSHLNLESADITVAHYRARRLYIKQEHDQECIQMNRNNDC